MKFLRRIFGIHDYVFIIHQRGFFSKNTEDDLRKKANEYVAKKLKYLWIQRKIVDTEIFNNNKTGDFFSIMTTFDIRRSKIWGIMMYQIYYFVNELNPERAFADYSFEKEEFKAEGQEVIVYKIKL